MYYLMHYLTHYLLHYLMHYLTHCNTAKSNNVKSNWSLTSRGRISDNVKSNALWPKTLMALPGSFVFHCRALTAHPSPIVHQQIRSPVSVTSRQSCNILDRRGQLFAVPFHFSFWVLISRTNAFAMSVLSVYLCELLKSAYAISISILPMYPISAIYPMYPIYPISPI